MGQIVRPVVSVALAGHGATVNLVLLMIAGTACYLIVRRLGR